VTSSEILMVVFTAVIAVTGVIGAIIFGGQLSVMQGQLTEMQSTGKQTDQLIEANKSLGDAAAKQAVAAERASTTGRAWVFVSLPMPVKVVVEPLTGSEGAMVTLNFVIENFGQTPAVITDFETHLVTDKASKVGNRRFFSADNVPEVNSAEFLASKEEFQQPIVSNAPGNFFFFDQNARTPIVIPANSKSIPISQTFFFYHGAIDQHGMWFYCAIKYKDIFGFDRETVYYAGIYGASAQLPNNPKYNHWN
jgi:hypothetical protein